MNAVQQNGPVKACRRTTMLCPEELVRIVHEDDDKCPGGTITLRIATAYAVFVHSRHWEATLPEARPVKATAAALCLLAVWGLDDAVKLLRNLDERAVLSLCLKYLRNFAVAAACCELADTLPLGRGWAESGPSPPLPRTAVFAAANEADNNDAYIGCAGGTVDDDDDDDDDDDNNAHVIDECSFTPGTKGVLHMIGFVPEDVACGKVARPSFNATRLVTLATQFCHSLADEMLAGEDFGSHAAGQIDICRRGAILLMRRGESAAYVPPVARQPCPKVAVASHRVPTTALHKHDQFLVAIGQCRCRRCVSKAFRAKKQ